MTTQQIDHGTVEHNGTVIRLTQEARNTNRDRGGPQYCAEGVDDAGNRYLVTWDVKEEFFELDGLGDHCSWKSAEELGYQPEEADLCDWDSPATVEQL